MEYKRHREVSCKHFLVGILVLVLDLLEQNIMMAESAQLLDNRY